MSANDPTPENAGSERNDYVSKMRAAIDRLQVKAGLAKLELRELRNELQDSYDHLHDRLQELAEAADDRWESLKEGVDAAWHAFSERYKKAMEEHGRDA